MVGISLEEKPQRVEISEAESLSHRRRISGIFGDGYHALLPQLRARTQVDLPITSSRQLWSSLAISALSSSTFRKRSLSPLL